MKSRTRFVWPGTFLAFLGFVAADACGQQELRWKLKPGDTLHYSRSIRQETKLSDGPEIRISRVEDGTWHVDRVEPDGSIRVTQTVDRCRGTVPSGKFERVRHEEFSYDTDQHYAPESVEGRWVDGLLKPLIGAEFSFTLTPQGEVRDLTLSEKARQIVADGPSGVARLLGERSLDGHIPKTPLPRDAVKVGDTWTEGTTFTDTGIGTRNLKTTYTYAGSVQRDGKRMERIDLKVETWITPPANSRVQVDEMTTQGEIVFDAVSGRLVERQETTTRKMTHTLAQGPVEENSRVTMSVKLTQLGDTTDKPKN